MDVCSISSRRNHIAFSLNQLVLPNVNRRFFVKFSVGCMRDYYKDCKMILENGKFVHSKGPLSLDLNAFAHVLYLSERGDTLLTSE